MNKNITWLDGVDPASVSPRPTADRSVCPFTPVSRFRSGVEWTGDRLASTWSPRRVRRLIAHLLRAGRWAEPLPSPTADWLSTYVKREARGKQLSSPVNSRHVSVRLSSALYTAGFINKLHCCRLQSQLSFMSSALIKQTIRTYCLPMPFCRLSFIDVFLLIVLGRLCIYGTSPYHFFSFFVYFVS